MRFKTVYTNINNTDQYYSHVINGWVTDIEQATDFSDMNYWNKKRRKTLTLPKGAVGIRWYHPEDWAILKTKYEITNV